jgi:hypothetical protein
VRPTQPHIQLVLGELSPCVKQEGSEADHLLSSSAEIKNEWYSTIPPYSFMVCTGTTLCFTEGNMHSFHCTCITGYHFSQWKRLWAKLTKLNNIQMYENHSSEGGAGIASSLVVVTRLWDGWLRRTQGSVFGRGRSFFLFFFPPPPL